MKIKYRNHARDRMLERGITETEVEYVLSTGNFDDGPNFHTIRTNGSGRSYDKDIFYANVEGRTDNPIAVVAIIPKDRNLDHEVVTVMVGYKPDVLNPAMWEELERKQ